MKNDRIIVADAKRAVQTVLDSLGPLTIESRAPATNRDAGWDAVLQVKGPGTHWKFAIEAKTRLTPQTALSVR